MRRCPPSADGPAVGSLPNPALIPVSCTRHTDAHPSVQAGCCTGREHHTPVSSRAQPLCFPRCACPGTGAPQSARAVQLVLQESARLCVSQATAYQPAPEPMCACAVWWARQLEGLPHPNPEPSLSVPAAAGPPGAAAAAAQRPAAPVPVPADAHVPCPCPNASSGAATGDPLAAAGRCGAGSGPAGDWAGADGMVLGLMSGSGLGWAAGSERWLELREAAANALRQCMAGAMQMPGVSGYGSHPLLHGPPFVHLIGPRMMSYLHPITQCRWQAYEGVRNALCKVT